MKIEFDIKDIERAEVIDAMAAQLLNQWTSDDEGNAYSRKSELGEALGRAVKERINKVADELIQRSFDDAIRARLSEAIDTVIAEGWYETDTYGGRKSEKLDLRARIGKVLSEPRGNSYDRKPSIVSERLDEAIKSFLDKELKAEVDKAKATLRTKLDASVMATVADTVKSALGPR